VKVLVVYDSVSPKKNTEKVAETIGDALRSKGMDVQSAYVKNVDPSSLKDYDCLIVGSPTNARRPTGLIRSFLDSLTPQVSSGKRGAAFDTRLKGWWAGGATGGIERKLGQLGFRIVVPGLATYVKGEKGGLLLLDGELDKAKKFAEEIVNALQ